MKARHALLKFETIERRIQLKLRVAFLNDREITLVRVNTI